MAWLENQTYLAHLLCVDLVRFSTTANRAQAEAVRQFSLAVDETSVVESAFRSDQLMILPTGDGAVFAFLNDPVAPVRCAEELASILDKRMGMTYRMGVHTGPVVAIRSADKRRNLIGAGINIAERVMRCANENQILLSSASADLVAQADGWDARLVHLGSRTVKHGKKLCLHALSQVDAKSSPCSKVLCRVQTAKLAHRFLLVLEITIAVIYLLALPYVALVSHIEAQRSENRFQMVIEHLTHDVNTMDARTRERAEAALWLRRNAW